MHYRVRNARITFSICIGPNHSFTVESTGSPESASLAWRLGAFLGGFLPEQNLQLLFPLASFLLLVGASYLWFRVVGLEDSSYRELLTDLVAHRRIWEPLEKLLRLLVECAFFASLVLWTLPVTKPVRKLLIWVVLPCSCAVVGYPIALVVTPAQKGVFPGEFAASATVLARGLRVLLGGGFYCMLAGVGILCSALLLVSRGKVSLPVRFRSAVRRSESFVSEISRDGKGVLIFIIGTAICGEAISLLFVLAASLGRPIQWRGRFAVYQWLPQLAVAVAAAWIAVLLLGERASQRIQHSFKVQRIREYGLAIGIPLIAVLGTRVVFKVVSESPVFNGPGWAYRWGALLPQPLPRILIVYLIALFEEFALRTYLQSTLEKHFSLAKSIFLTALLWAVSPLGYGTALSVPDAIFYQIPGASILALIVVLIAYSVPMGWLYARTRSVVLVALMHGTIALFHLGEDASLHVRFPALYWFELGFWILIGWYLFRKYPSKGTAETAVTAPEPV